jgi:hypothetical protein
VRWWWWLRRSCLDLLISFRVDGFILNATISPLPRREVVARITRSGFPIAEVRQRVNALIEARLLLRTDQQVVLARLGEPTSYATFMVNVSQRCNLTCPYCYVNKGHFDYVEKPIPRMRADTAAQIVERVFEHFPGISTYGYHFYGGEPLMNFPVIRQIVDAAEAKAAETRTHTDYGIRRPGFEHHRRWLALRSRASFRVAAVRFQVGCLASAAVRARLARRGSWQ